MVPFYSCAALRPRPRPRLCLCLPLPWLLALAAASMSANAEPTARPIRPDPLDAKAPVPSVVYRSSLRLLKTPAGDKPVTWQEANDNVARIGGWRVYAREAQQPATVPAAQPLAAPAVSSPPAVAPAHSGHKLP